MSEWRGLREGGKASEKKNQNPKKGASCFQMEYLSLNERPEVVRALNRARKKRASNKRYVRVYLHFLSICTLF